MATQSVPGDVIERRSVDPGGGLTRSLLHHQHRRYNLYDQAVGCLSAACTFR
jgi:hypothetical protein